MKSNFILLLLVSVLFSSCSDELVEDYISGTWELKAYLRNNLDETSEMQISEYEESYSLDGVFSRSYLDGEQNLVEEQGKFSINEDGMSIHISDVSSIADFSSANSTLSTSVVDVISIDDIEYVYSFENGGDMHEFRFIKKD